MSDKDPYAGRGGAYVMVNGKRVPEKDVQLQTDDDPGDEQPAPAVELKTRPAVDLKTR
jgi:hypothetical protein